MKLFISYSREDKAWVYELWRALRDRADHDAWIDQRLLPAQDWWNTILHNIEDSECCIYVMTPQSVASIFCRAEVDYAVALNKPLIPLMLKPSDYPPNLGSKRIQYQIIRDNDSIGDVLFIIERALGIIREGKARDEYQAPHPLPSRPDEPKPEQTPEQISEVFMMAEEAASEGNFSLADKLFQAVIDADPDGYGLAAAERMTTIDYEHSRSQEYLTITRMVNNPDLLQGALSLWRVFREKHGSDYDPNNLGLILAEHLAPESPEPVQTDPPEAVAVSMQPDSPASQMPSGVVSHVLDIDAHDGWVLDVAFSPDGKLLASAGSSDKTVRLWSVADGREIVSLEGHESGVEAVAFSPDGRLLASASDDQTICLWNVAEAREIVSLEGHTGGIKAVAFSPNGKLLASVGDDDPIRLWSVDEQQEIKQFMGHSDINRAVAFSPDGTLLASASEDKTIRLWSVHEGREVATLHGHGNAVVTVAFSPDGKQLASAGGSTTSFGLASGDIRIRLWDLAERQEIAQLEGHTWFISQVVFSPDGTLLASASSDKSVRLWDVAEAREVWWLEGHTAAVRTVAFSPDGKLLASAGEDLVIKLWSFDQSAL